MGVGWQGRRVRRSGRRATCGREDERVRKRERRNASKGRRVSGKRRLRVSMGTVYIRPLFREKRGIYPIPKHQDSHPLPPSSSFSHSISFCHRSVLRALLLPTLSFSCPESSAAPFPFFPPPPPLRLSVCLSPISSSRSWPSRRRVSRYVHPPPSRYIAVGPLFFRQKVQQRRIFRHFSFSAAPLTRLTRSSYVSVTRTLNQRDITKVACPSVNCSFVPRL